MLGDMALLRIRHLRSDRMQILSVDEVSMIMLALGDLRVKNSDGSDPYGDLLLKLERVTGLKRAALIPKEVSSSDQK